MPLNIFLTGASGYIGGDVLYDISRTHPDYHLSLLVRSKDKGETIQASYPEARIVHGSLDDAHILEEESSKADVVIHTADASDHEGAAKAIAAGLIKGHSKAKPGYWLHTGGTGILTFTDAKREVYGEVSEKEYDDWEGVTELTHLPDDAFHRNVDKLVLEAGTQHGDSVKTAIICPPTIYGRGRGPCSQRGRQVYELARVTLSLKKGPIIGKGKARWNNVNVSDLSNVFVLLTEAAAANDTRGELWGDKGYYLTENGEHYWGDISKLVAKAAADQKFIPSEETESMDVEEAKKHAGFESLSWGMNSRAKALRAGKLLGWKPHGRSLEDEIPIIVESEQKRSQE